MRMSIVTVRKPKALHRFLAVFLAFSLLLVWMGLRIKPLITGVAKGYGENVVANALSEMVEEELKSTKYQFFDIIYDGSGSVSAVMTNSGDINHFMARIILRLKEKIVEMEEFEASIPLGNFFSNPFFSGVGPNIPVKFLILSNTSITAEDKFEAKGINQTLYTVELRIDTKIGIYLPGMSESMTMTNFIPISQTLVVGKVPDTYTNVEGMEGTVQDTVLDIE